MSRSQTQTVFQPIINHTTDKAVAFEVINRPELRDCQRDADAMVNLGTSSSHIPTMWELTQSFRAMREFKAIEPVAPLFINFSAHTVESICQARPLRERFLRAELDPSRLVIEISDRAELTKLLSYKPALAELRDAGIQFALTDFGAGYAGLRIWSELLPHYIKLAPFFLQRSRSCMITRRVVENLVSVAETVDARLIASGIDTKPDLEAAVGMDIHWVQGALLKAPHRLDNTPVETTPRRPSCLVSARSRFATAVGDRDFQPAC